MKESLRAIEARPGFAYGDVSCLNCGRVLGLAVRRLGDGATAIRPLRPGEEIGVELRGGRGLRCKPCGGRAFVEFDEMARTPPVTSVPAEPLVA